MNYSHRNKNKIVKYIVLHYTGMKDFKSAYKKLNDLKSEVSCHYLISRSGIIYHLLGTNLKAWHAGDSKWGGLFGLNDYSIGIEIENKGHEHGYQNFTKKQYKSINSLLRSLAFFYSIKITNVLGHSEIAPQRKIDPGEKFNWDLIKITK